MKITIYQKAGIDYPANQQGQERTAAMLSLIQEIREKLELRPYPQDTIDIFEDEPDEIGQLAKEQQEYRKEKEELELLRDRYATMASNPPLTAYAHNDRATIKDYEGTMKDLEQQLREAGAMP